MARDGRAPAFQWYGRDFIATMFGCTLEEIGAVAWLRSVQWEHGPRPVSGLCRDLRVSPAKLRSLMPAIHRIFAEHPAGFLADPDIESQRETHRRFREAQRAKGLLSAALRGAESFDPGSTGVATGDPTEGQPETQPDWQPETQPDDGSAFCGLHSAGVATSVDVAPPVPRPTRKKGGDKPALPFRAARAASLVLEGAGPDHFILPAAPMTGGHAVAIEKFIRTYPHETSWRTLGEYLASGRLNWLKEAVGVPFLASGQLPDIMTRALRWSEAGKPAPGAPGVVKSIGAAYQPSAALSMPPIRGR